MATRTRFFAGGFVAGATAQNKAEFWDGGAGTYTAYNAGGTVVSTRALTAPEAAELAGVDTQNTLTTNIATLQSRAMAALVANATFLAIASPTAAQVRDQVILVTKELNALIRLTQNMVANITDTA